MSLEANQYEIDWVANGDLCRGRQLRADPPKPWNAKLNRLSLIQRRKASIRREKSGMKVQSGVHCAITWNYRTCTWLSIASKRRRNSINSSWMRIVKIKPNGKGVKITEWFWQRTERWRRTLHGDVWWQNGCRSSWGLRVWIKYHEIIAWKQTEGRGPRTGVRESREVNYTWSYCKNNRRGRYETIFQKVQGHLNSQNPTKIESTGSYQMWKVSDRRSGDWKSVAWEAFPKGH